MRERADRTPGRATAGTAGSRRGRIRRWLAQGVALVTAVALPAALAAQQAAEAGAGDAGGGIRLTFGFDTRVESHTNSGLAASGGRDTREYDSRLSFGFLTETRTSRLALDAALRARGNLGGDGGANDVVNPDLTLSYARQGAGSSLDTQAFLRETDLGRDNTLEDFDGNQGTRRDTGGSITLRWGDDAPVGFGVNASYTDSNFSDGAGQPDRTRLRYGATLRLDLTQATRLTLGLTQSRFDAADDSPRDTTTLDAGLAFDRPQGALTLDLRLEDTPEGTRSSVTAGQTFEMPDGQLTARLGLTRGTSGATRVTGGLTYAHDLPRGQLTADLARDVTSGAEDDGERRITRASLGLTQALTPRTTLLLDLGLSESRATGGDATTQNGNASATLRYDLAQDWNLDVGVSHRLRDTDTTDTARDTSVFLGLSRNFEVRY